MDDYWQVISISVVTSTDLLRTMLIWPYPLHAFLFIRTPFIRTSASDSAKKLKHFKNMLSLRLEDQKNIFFKKLVKLDEILLMMDILIMIFKLII